MKIIKYSIYIALSGILLGVMIFITYTLLIYLSARDIENVELKGYILDNKTNDPIENVMVIIESDRYKSNSGYTNYDEYLGHDKVTLYTNKRGYFYTKIPKSAFLGVFTYKNGYKNYIGEYRYSEKSMIYEIRLEGK